MKIDMWSIWAALKHTEMRKNVVIADIIDGSPFIDGSLFIDGSPFH